MAYRSSGADNAEVVRNLRGYGIVESEQVFRALLEVDRGDFVPPEHRREAYLDQPLLAGRVHLSAPHIYGTVLEALDLQPGLSFLNVGSGTGYLSTVAGFLLQGRGVNHGVEIEAEVVAHAQACHARYLGRYNLNTSGGGNGKAKAGLLTVTPASFFVGNVFELEEERSMRYDRIYVGAECPPVVKEKLMSLLLPRGGVLVGPMGDELVRITRRGGPEQGHHEEAAGQAKAGSDYETEFLCAVRFAPLKTRPVDQLPATNITAAAAAAPAAAAIAAGGPMLPGGAPTADSNGSGHGNGNNAEDGEGTRTAGRARSRSGSFHLPPPVWSPALHYSYPLHFRVSARALLLCAARPGTPLHKGLPPALCQEVLSFADRLWFEPPAPTPKSDGSGGDGAAGVGGLVSGLKRKLSSASSSLLRGVLFRSSSSSSSSAGNAASAVGGGGGNGHDMHEDGEPPSYHAMLALSSLMQSAQGWGSGEEEEEVEDETDDTEEEDDTEDEDEEEDGVEVDTGAASGVAGAAVAGAAGSATFPAPPVHGVGEALAALVMGMPSSAFHGATYSDEEDAGGGGGSLHHAGAAAAAAAAGAGGAGGRW